MMSSNASPDSKDSNSASSKPEDDKQPHMRWSDTSSTTNDFPSSASATVATAAVARHPTAQTAKPRRAGFREQFLQKLRVMLDRESQNDSASARWSIDGNSFIIMDHTRFEEQTIPTYFGNQIVFASFLRKLQRWGFNRVSTKQAGRYEFFSPTFKRIGVESPPAVGAAAAAAAAAAVNTTGNDRGVQQQPTLAFSPLLQVMAQTNQPPAPNLLTNQADANAITALLSNIQRQSTGQQSVLNLNTNQPNNADGILQSIMGSTLLSQNTVPSLQQPVLNNVDANSYLQPFQQWQPPNPTINLLNTILNNLVGGHQMSLDQLMGYSSPSLQINAERALMSLCGMVLPQHTLPITNTSAPMSQPNNVAVQTLLMLIRQVGEEELQRRAQVDAIQNAIMTSIGRSLGQDGFSNNNSMQTQQGVIPPSRQQTLGSNHDNFVQRQQVGTSPPSAGNGNLNIQADSIAAILQAARRGEAAGWLEEDDDARNGSDESSCVNQDNNGDNEERPFSARKRNSSSDDDADDDDSWNEISQPRKKSRK